MEVKPVQQAMEQYNLFQRLNPNSGKPAFDKMDIKRCAEVNSLQEASRIPGLKAFEKLLADASLAPRLGFNVGTRAVTVLVNLPSAPLTAPQPDELAKSLIWLMLGIHPEQRQLEQAYAEMAPHPEKTADPLLSSKPWLVPEPQLANRCLQLFTAQTGVVITTRELNYRLGNMKLTVSADKSKSRQEPIPYRYGPKYTQLLGMDQEGKMSDDQYVSDQNQLLQGAVSNLWKSLEDQRYIVHEQLMQAMSEPLFAYLKAGMAHQAASFLPKRAKLQFYLHGRAGIGKSEFVKVFSRGLEGLIQQNLQPSTQVAVVKLPLNSITIEDLVNITQVKGISDMSVERMIEQGLAKGSVVIFHLEECPEDFAFQEQLFAATQKVLANLRKRYPDKMGNIVTLVTSNHPPAPAVAAEVAEVTMLPPSAAMMQRWTVAELQARLEALRNPATGAAVEVQQVWHHPPPAHADMRMQRWWTTTFALHAQQHAARVLRDAAAAPSSSEGEEGAPAAVRLQMLRVSDTEIDVAAGAVGASGRTELDELRRVRCEEGSVLNTRGELHGATVPALTAHGVPAADHAKILTVLEMFKADYLQPVVLTLMGTEASRAAYRAGILELVRAEHGAKLRETHLTLLAEEDKEHVMGQVSDVRGGLFKFIDEVNNPNAAAEEGLYGAVVATVNETGQFMLRELNESGRSRTHRLQVFKDRLMFLMDIVEGAALTHQLHSRSIAILGDGC
mmetsp:Transcript_7767/g.15880  ORF Transcript_7767/g.15880 Transcript_7767/m.15880 type:complete len:729 (-) Transcript_7767:634-2820(-)